MLHLTKISKKLLLKQPACKLDEAKSGNGNRFAVTQTWEMSAFDCMHGVH